MHDELVIKNSLSFHGIKDNKIFHYLSKAYVILSCDSEMKKFKW